MRRILAGAVLGAMLGFLLSIVAQSFGLHGAAASFLPGIVGGTLAAIVIFRR